MRWSCSGFIVAVLLGAVSGCDSASPLGPTSRASGSVPSATTTPPRDDGVVAVAGFVQDRAWRSLPGGRVEVLNGAHEGLSALVDHRGEFRLAGVFDATTRFRATAPGHRDVILSLPERCAACNPNWWIFFYLESVNGSPDLSGEYAVTFRADTTCTQIPEAFRSRTYTATVETAEGGRFNVSLRGGSFLPGYDRMTLGVAGEYFALPLGDYHGTPGVAEEVAPRTYLGFEGSVEGSLASAESGTFTATMNGEITFCELSAPASAHYGCRWEPAVSRATCTSARHEVILHRTLSASR